MSRPFKTTRPVRVEQECSDCDGAGQTQDEDFDEHGRHLVNVRCEACCGLGYLFDCDRCDECTPVAELEDGGGICSSCRILIETGDAQAEMARIARVA